MTSSIDIAKQALAIAGTRSTINAIDDSTQEGRYIGLLYGPMRDFMLREGDYDWALQGAVPTLSGSGIGPIWPLSYSYPNVALRIRSLVPTVYDPLDPMPMEWNVATVGAVRYILTKEAAQTVIFTYAPPEDSWDPLFREAFVRFLASGLVFALENRLEASDKLIGAAMDFAGIANLRDS